MVDRLAAELGIRRLHALCADAVWRRDPVAFGGCFTQEAEWKIAGLRVRGREAIGRALLELGAGNERVLMSFSHPILDIEGGTVSGRTYAVERAFLKGGGAASSIGIYYERFAQSGADWLFAWRHFDFCYWGPVDLSGELYGFQDYGPPPTMPADEQTTAGLTV
ncbi:nuclear transport factor 2 family protein [Novosphingobium sp. M1R2S20]|uniref:Nuclear transport factor 2 family protein n=1 Tax=Novosphingobium rhizovicinum TaxID=3228928 RepID=A0ABV3RF50_9SPHN